MRPKLFPAAFDPRCALRRANGRASLRNRELVLPSAINRIDAMAAERGLVGWLGATGKAYCEKESATCTRKYNSISPQSRFRIPPRTSSRSEPHAYAYGGEFIANLARRRRGKKLQLDWSASQPASPQWRFIYCRRSIPATANWPRAAHLNIFRPPQTSSCLAASLTPNF